MDEERRCDYDEEANMNKQHGLATSESYGEHEGETETQHKKREFHSVPCRSL